MPRLTLLPVVAAILCAFAAQAEGVAGPAVLQADQIEGKGSAETTATGHVQIDQDGRRIEAQWMKLFEATNELKAGDKTRMTQRKDVLEGGELTLKQDTNTGQLDAPVFTLGVRQGRGDALKLLFEGQDKYRLDDARFTTCRAGSDDWFIHARDLELDYTRNLGIARSSTVDFFGVPILYSPYLDFSLNGARKSGFLAPSIGTAGGGFEFTMPYYWNIAPNMDATFSPRVMSKRGVLFSNEFRYMGKGYTGQITGEAIAHDREYGGNRTALNVQHKEDFAPGWHGEVNVQRTSDDRYFADFGDRIAVSSQTYLPREGWLGYTGGGVAATLRFSRFQTLQDPTNLISSPYARMPQLIVNYSQQVAKLFRLDVATESTKFANAWNADGTSRPDGTRLVAYPSISMPIERAYGFINPKIGFHSSSYTVEDGRHLSRNLPIFSVDSGLYFDRESTFMGRDIVQSLEPRAYYVRIPYRDQSNFPNFDSGVADFNFAQMFSENQYTGSDRINDANQLTLAATSRFFEADTGIERARLAIGQRFYSSEQRVTLTETARSQDVTASDLIATAGGQPYDNWWLDSSVQTDNKGRSTRKASFNLRYQPEAGKILNLRYQLNKLTDIKQVDISAQWPINQRWYVVARENWSVKDKRTLERLAGLEYNGGCWVFRMVSQRFVTSGNQTSSPFFVQLELNDLGRLGSNPLQTLKESIPGYTKLK